MILLLDIGNTHTHVGIMTQQNRVRTVGDMSTERWFGIGPRNSLSHLVSRTKVKGVCLCSVVPKATRHARRFFREQWDCAPLILTHQTVRGVGIDYPKPSSIGPDRLANAAAVFAKFGAPSVVVDFGTAVTFDVIDAQGRYTGGIIAPGLAAMTGYLHEKTALLPRIHIRETRAIIGKNTEQAMLIGAVHGYRGLIRELLQRLQAELRCRRLPVVATGGYARLMAHHMPEITEVDGALTLKGLALTWQAHHT